MFVAIEVDDGRPNCTIDTDFCFLRGSHAAAAGGQAWWSGYLVHSVTFGQYTTPSWLETDDLALFSH